MGTNNSKAGYHSANTYDDHHDEPHKLNKEAKDIDEDLMYNVTPLSIGSDLSYDEMLVEIPKNTPIPTKKFESLSTTGYDNQESIIFSFYQGERKRASDNQLLGTLSFEGIPPAPRGVPVITVCLDVDAKGTLNVCVEDKSTGTKAAKSIPGVGVRGKARVATEEEVEKMARQGEKHESEDEEYLKRVKVINEMQEYAIVIRKNAAAGAYSTKALIAFKDVVKKMLDEFKEKAKEFGLEGDMINVQPKLANA